MNPASNHILSSVTSLSSVAPLGLPTESRDEVFAHVDLKNHFPICFRSVLKRSFRWMFGFFIAFVCLALAPDAALLADGDKQTLSLRVVLAGLTVVLGGGALLKLLYEILYRRSYYYAIQAGHLVISKGVFLKKRGLFPLSRITDVYLDKSVMDFLLGLANVHVSTPTTSSGRFAHVEGLTRSMALALQLQLTMYLESVEPAHKPFDGPKQDRSADPAEPGQKANPADFIH